MKHWEGQASRNCIVGSLSILFQKSPAEIQELLGCDPFELIFPGLAEPLCYRGVHMEELPYLAERLGSFFTFFYPTSATYMPEEGHEYQVNLDDRFEAVLQKYDGLLVGELQKTGEMHAVAWSHQEQLIYDPAGHTTDKGVIRPECFAALVRGA